MKKGMYKSYIIELQIPKGRIKEAIYQDMKNPYHYFRIDPQGDYDRVILGGEDHRAELRINPDKNYEALTDYAKTLFE